MYATLYYQAIGSQIVYSFTISVSTATSAGISSIMPQKLLVLGRLLVVTMGGFHITMGICLITIVVLATGIYRGGLRL